MPSIEAFLLGLIVSMTPLVSTPMSQFAQGATSVDTSNKSCEDAKKLAISGIFFGTQSGKGTVIDSCVAAVYDPSGVSVVEVNPKQNPKNYKCVGKNVRITMGDKGVVTESWSAAANVKAGMCSTQYCSGSYCGKATPFSGFESSTTGSEPSSYTDASFDVLSSEAKDFSRVLWSDEFLRPQSEQEVSLPLGLSNQIDDAFLRIESGMYEVDANGIPDVSQFKNSNLMRELNLEADNRAVMINYEEFGSNADHYLPYSPEYQELASLNDRVAVTFDSTDPDLQALFSNQPISEYSPSRFTPNATFQAEDDVFWADWRRSENVEQQTLLEWTAAKAEDLSISAVDWFVTASYRVSSLWQRTFSQ